MHGAVGTSLQSSGRAAAVAFAAALLGVAASAQASAPPPLAADGALESAEIWLEAHRVAPWWAEQEQPVAEQQPERWSSFLPLMKEEALSRGYQLPLPFGAGVTFTVLTGRDIEVTDLRIGVDGAEPTSVSDFVDVGSESEVFNSNLKLDAWLLPFLNVYVLAGYVYNESKTNVHVSLPGSDFDLDVDTKLDGFVGGGGLTLAAGYEDFFMVMDSNWSQTDIGFDDSFRAITASARAGYLTELSGKPLQLWTGAAYWDTANTAKGTKDVPGVGRVEFEADQGPEFPWLLDFGSNLRVAPGCEFFVDLAFDLNGGTIFTIGPVFRF